MEKKISKCLQSVLKYVLKIKWSKMRHLFEFANLYSDMHDYAFWLAFRPSFPHLEIKPWQYWKINSLTVSKKNFWNKKIPDRLHDPIFKFWLGWGQTLYNFFFWPFKETQT